LERREAKEAALGQWVPALGGASPAQQPCLLPCSFATGGRCLQVEQWMLTGLSRQPEEVCSERWPGWLVGEFGDDLLGSGVERLNDLGSN
jgi:hypothetical protein